MVNQPERYMGQQRKGLRPEAGARPESGKKLEKLQLSEEELCKSCTEMSEARRRSKILEIQQFAEKVLKAHRLLENPEALFKGDWFLKLGKPGFEKKLVISKSAEELFVGLYSYSEETPIPDPILVLLSQNGFWYPQRIEDKFDETVCSFFTGAYGDYEFLTVIPENLEKFQAFQKNFTKTLEKQDWTASDVEVIEKIRHKG